ncbi:thioredoxin domain-containing protein [Microtetraspora sp. NBRC 16547]|uniref:DsbA family protein n=1 Tax=Microtetraspora sp. NBRC 16547 TaxID=3030993 RepID=UPI0024A06D58|nr:thioredoxin domain-containing protein [Microtetraspora sp. NBRC 16547]GLW97056.1 membrane protein [Microtetraspora sp. NBRC 16547]
MSKSARQRSARERVAEERRKQRAREKQRKLLLGVIGGLVAASVAVVAVVAVQDKAGKSSQKAIAYTGPAVTATRQADGSILMAKEGVTGPTLEVFGDFQCPACRKLDERAGDAMKKAASDGKARVVYRPFQLLTAPDFPEPIPSVSRRGANAAFCAPADKWASYAKTLYAYQPEEGKNGFENKELLNWSRDLGFYSPEFDKCVTGMEKADDIAKATQYAKEQQVTSTPTLKLNGKKLENKQMEEIFADPSSLERILATAAS